MPYAMRSRSIPHRWAMCSTRDPFGRLLGEAFRRGSGPGPNCARADLRRNLPLGVAIAALNGFADALLLPSVIVAAFVARVSDSNELVALVPVVAALSWGLPGAIARECHRQPHADHRAGSDERRPARSGDGVARLYWRGARGRLGATIACDLFRSLRAWSAARAASRRSWASVCRGASRRMASAGRFVRWQALAGAIASVLAALLVRRILVHGPVFPREYLYLFFVAFLALLGVALLTAALAERAQPRCPSCRVHSLAGFRAAPGTCCACLPTGATSSSASSPLSRRSRNRSSSSMRSAPSMSPPT